MRSARSLVLGLSLLVAGCGTLPRQDATSNEALSGDETVFAEALAHYAEGLLLEGEHGVAGQDALDQYLKADTLDPGRRRTAGRIALGALRNNKPQLAVDTLTQYCNENPDDADAWVELASVNRLLGKTDAALEEYVRASRLKPDRSLPYAAQAEILFERKADKQALDILETGLARVSDTRELLAVCQRNGTRLLRGGDVRRAIPCFEAVGRHGEPLRREIYHLLGELYSALKDDDTAARYYSLATEQPNPMTDAFVKLAVIQQKTEPLKAVETLRQALTIAPDDAFLHLLLGELYLKTDQHDKAVESLTASTRCRPPLADAFIKLALLRMTDEEDAAGAIETLKQAAQLLPSDVGIAFMLASVYQSEKRYADAVDEFEKIRARAADAKNERLTALFYLRFAGAYELAGDRERAETILEEGLKTYPDNAEMFNFLAYMWAEQGVKLDLALDYSRRSLKDQPDNAAYLDTLGWIFFKQKKFDAALEQLRRANELEKEEPTLLDHLGDVYRALGRDADAVSCWSDSYRLDPANTSVRDKLKQAGVDTTTLHPPADEPAPAPTPAGTTDP